MISKQKVDKPAKAYLLTYYIRILLYIDFEKYFKFIVKLSQMADYDHRIFPSFLVLIAV